MVPAPGPENAAARSRTRSRIAGAIDPRSLAEAVAVQTDEAILEGLRARLREPVADAEWDRLVLVAEVERAGSLSPNMAIPTRAASTEAPGGGRPLGR